MLFLLIESLDQLEEMVFELFDNVKDKNVEAPSWEEPPFSKEQLATCAYIVPVKDVRNLNIIFPAKDMTKHYKSAVSTFNP